MADGARARGGVTTRLAAAGLAALGWLGCVADGPVASSLDDSTYVEVMARLAFIRQQAESSRSPDTVRWADSSRLAVLDDYGVDGDALQRYAARHGGDPVRMGRLWEHVADLVDAFAVRAARSEGPVELGRDALRAAPDTSDGGTP